MWCICTFTMVVWIGHWVHFFSSSSPEWKPRLLRVCIPLRMENRYVAGPFPQHGGRMAEKGCSAKLQKWTWDAGFGSRRHRLQILCLVGGLGEVLFVHSCEDVYSYISGWEPGFIQENRCKTKVSYTFWPSNAPCQVISTPHPQVQQTSVTRNRLDNKIQRQVTVVKRGMEMKLVFLHLWTLFHGKIWSPHFTRVASS